MDDSLIEGLYINALMGLVMKCREDLSPVHIARQMDSNALALIAQIRDILNDKHFSDSECFYRIDDIVAAFYRAGVPVDRHWEVD